MLATLGGGAIADAFGDHAAPAAEPSTAAADQAVADDSATADSAAPVPAAADDAEVEDDVADGADADLDERAGTRA
jgi:hypothetical protein